MRSLLEALVSPSYCSTNVFSFTAEAEDNLNQKNEDSGLQSQSDFYETLQKASKVHPERQIGLSFAHNPPSETGTKVQLKFKQDNVGQIEQTLPNPIHLPDFESNSPLLQMQSLIPEALESEPLPVKLPCETTIKADQTKNKFLDMFLGKSEVLQTETKPADVCLKGEHTTSNERSCQVEGLEADGLEKLLAKYLGPKASRESNLELHPSGMSMPMSLVPRFRSVNSTISQQSIQRQLVSSYLRSHEASRSLGESGNHESFVYVAEQESAFSQRLDPSTVFRSSCSNHANRHMHSSLTFSVPPDDTNKEKKSLMETRILMQKKTEALLRLNSNSCIQTLDNSLVRPRKYSTIRTTPSNPNIKNELLQRQRISLVSPNEGNLDQRNGPKIGNFVSKPQVTVKETAVTTSRSLKSTIGCSGTFALKASYQTTGPQPLHLQSSYSLFPKDGLTSSQFSYPRPKYSTARSHLGTFAQSPEDSKPPEDSQTKKEVFFCIQRSKEARECFVRVPTRSVETNSEFTKTDQGIVHKSFKYTVTPAKTVTVDCHSNIPEGRAHQECSENEIRRRMEDQLRHLTAKVVGHPSASVFRHFRNLNESSITSLHSNFDQKERTLAIFPTKAEVEPSQNGSIEVGNDCYTDRRQRSVTFDFERTDFRQDSRNPVLEAGKIRSILKNKKPNARSFSKFLEMEKSLSQLPVNLTKFTTQSRDFGRQEPFRSCLPAKSLTTQIDKTSSLSQASHSGNYISNSINKPISTEYLRVYHPVANPCYRGLPDVSVKGSKPAETLFRRKTGSFFEKIGISSHQEVPLESTVYPSAHLPNKLCLNSKEGSSLRLQTPQSCLGNSRVTMMAGPASRSDLLQ